jgi:spore coat polysaccharide biosynthesis protein SpsF
MTALFLQCRLDSTRLPGKALLPLAGVPLIERVMTALDAVQADVKVLLTTEDSRSGLMASAGKCGFELFAGSKEDVLDRFIKAADHYGADRIIRATGDNPFVSAYLANRINMCHDEARADYSGYLGMPLGTGVEILETEALRKAARESDSPFDHEHVAPYLYNNPDKFRINRPDISSEYGYGGRKISVDTGDDLDLAERILKGAGGIFPLEIDGLIGWLKRDDGR